MSIRALNFSQEECTITILGYKELKETLMAKSNSVTVNKTREACWWRTADTPIFTTQSNQSQGRGVIV